MKIHFLITYITIFEFLGIYQANIIDFKIPIAE